MVTPDVFAFCANKMSAATLLEKTTFALGAFQTSALVKEMSQCTTNPLSLESQGDQVRCWGHDEAAENHGCIYAPLLGQVHATYGLTAAPVHRMVTHYCAAARCGTDASASRS